MAPKLGIIVLNYNNFTDTKLCINSIENLGDMPNHEIFLVDNASPDQSGQRLAKEFQKITYIQNELNTGYNGGNNLGIKVAKEKGCNLFLLLNNDTIVKTSDSIKILIQKLYYSDFGICGFKQINLETNVISSTKTRSFFFTLLNKFLVLPQTDLNYLSGFALGISIDTINKIGLLPESYFMYFEEQHFCYKARLNQIKICEIEDPNLGILRKADKKSLKPYYWYYNVRNGLYFLSDLPLTKFQFGISSICLIILQLKIIIANRNLKSNIKAYSRGILDFYKKKKYKSY